MSEKFQHQFEQKVEHIPTLEEVNEVLGQMVKGEYQEAKRIMDEQGNLYILEVIAPGEKEGESIVLGYRRKVYASGDKATEIEIHSGYFYEGDYVTAGPQASLIGDKWVFME